VEISLSKSFLEKHLPGRGAEKRQPADASWRKMKGARGLSNVVVIMGVSVKESVGEKPRKLAMGRYDSGFIIGKGQGEKQYRETKDIIGPGVL